MHAGLHVYPLRLYDFADGLYVVGSIGPEDITGRRVTAIGDTPIDEVVELVRPLVPHDNASGFRWLLPEYLATAEVLRGLGIVEGDTATFSFADGTEAALEPVDAGEVASTLGGAPAPLPTGHDPVWLRDLATDQWLTTLEGGKVVYLGYRLTTGPTYDTAERLFALARKPGVRRVVVDVRLNHGGDNTTYAPLLDVLAGLSCSGSSSSSPAARPSPPPATSSRTSIAPRARASSASRREERPASGATRSRSCSNAPA